MTKQQKLLILGFLMAIVVVLYLIFNPSERAQANPEDIIPAITECYQNGDQNQCYRNVAEKFSDVSNLTKIFAVISANEQQPAIFKACHETLHFLGREIFSQKKDTKQALEYGDPVCFAGYYHGVLEGYLQARGSAELSADEIKGLCGTQSDFSSAKKFFECLHGLGHAFMFFTDTDLVQSLKLCDNLDSDSNREWCYSGSFMENSSSSTNEDHPSRFLRAEDPMYPCSILEEKYLTICYTLQGFYFADISNYDWKKTTEICLRVPKDYIAPCFNSIGQYQVGFTQDPKIQSQNCMLAPVEYQGSCVQGVIGALAERYNDEPEKIEAFCNALPSTLSGICQGRNSLN